MPEPRTAYQELRDGSFGRDMAQYFSGSESQAQSLAYQAWLLYWLMNRGELALRTTMLTVLFAACALLCQHRLRLRAKNDQVELNAC
jgi:hypothetical protein